MKKIIERFTVKWRINGHFRFDFSYPYFVYVGFKHSKRFIISVMLGYFEIVWQYKDWFIETAPTISGGVAYKTFSVNPKYKDEEIVCFSIPA